MQACCILVLSLIQPIVGDIGHVCRHASQSDGGCLVDGSNCADGGESVEFAYFPMNVSQWANTTKTNNLVGKMSSYAIAGRNDTWQMYLHGPLMRPGERASPTSIPPVYTHATWTNKIYRFDFLEEPLPGRPLPAKQKMVGWALAPSTSFPLEDSHGSLKGLLVAEGQPFWLSTFGGFKLPIEVGKGGVDVILNDPSTTCNKIFPSDPMHKIFGQVVNTVDCHRRLGVCFFTVWKFYDDTYPIWSNLSERIAPDCLYYCIVENLGEKPTCTKTAIATDEHGQQICHKKGVGAVHGMTIGVDNPEDTSQFDIFLIFTGVAAFDRGESSMKKVRVQVTPEGHADRDLSVLASTEYGKELFVDLPAPGLDAGGDHAWVDDTGKFVWVSTFRTGAPGVHMLDYVSGALLYSVQGLDRYLPGQYLYSAGIHGVGTLGRKGSYIAVATSACKSASICGPIPWSMPFPKKLWTKGVQFVIDIGSFETGSARVEYV